MKFISKNGTLLTRLATTAVAVTFLGVIAAPSVGELAGFDFGAAYAQDQGANKVGKGSGQGGPSAESDGQGPKSQAGKPAEGKKGKPVWAQEGIPAVELGRLSVARSPDQVLDRQLAEAVSTINALSVEDKAALVALYDGGISDIIASITPATWDSLVIIDSPLQNLAVLRDLYDGGTVALSSYLTSPKDDLAAVLIGVASDKTLPISRDTVVALNVILNLGLSDSDITKIAINAEAVRQAVLLAHG